MTDLDMTLTQTGDALQRAWHADLRAPRRRLRRLVPVAAAVLAVGVGAAAAASVLKSPAQESASMIAGVTLFRGSDPTCVSMSRTSYRCTLATTPTGETFGSTDGTSVFLGMKMETVSADHHVDGGCVSVSTDGTVWDCYVGQEAVDHDIIGQAMLGQYQDGPAAG